VGKSVDLEELPRPGAFLESEPSRPGFAEDFDPSSNTWWELSGTGKRLSGIRHDADGSDQAIALDRVAEDCAPAYEERRLDLPVTFGERTRENDVVVEKGTHPLTGVGALRIVSGIPETPAAAINAWLDEARRELDSLWVDCSDWEGSVTAAFVSTSWLVFDVNASGFCGGVHPNESSTPIAFDAQEGKRIDFSDWIGDGYWSYASGVEGDLRTFLVERMQADAPECAEHRLEAGFGGFTPWLGPDGFAFRLDETDRAYAACDGDYVLTFAQIRPFIDPDHLSAYDRFVAEAGKLPRP
jgi:hypothetical protein